MMDLVAADRLSAHKLLKGLGPEPLGNSFNGPYLAAALKGKRTPIKAALLDQSVVAGLGNIYVCEALYHAGCSPRRQAFTVQGGRAEKLARAIRDVLDRAIAAGAPACATTFRPTANWVTSSTIGRSTAAKARPAPAATVAAAEAFGEWSSPDVPPFTVRRGSARMNAPGEPKRLSMKLFRALAWGLAVAVVALTGPQGPVAAQDGFIAGVEDLPLMPGLSEIADAGLVFDKPSGRIVEAFAEGAVSRQAVESFYDSTLPQLGWSPQPDRTFQRDGERLLIKVREGAEGVTVEYRLAPE